MKVFLIIPTLAKGGAERVVANLSHGLSQAGYEVFIIIFSGPVAYPISGQLINLNISYSSFFKIKILFNLIKIVFSIKALLKQHQPDYLFSFMGFANFASILAAGNKACVSERIDLSHVSKTSKFLSSFLYPKARVVIAVSQALSNKLKLEYQLHRVETIYNPIDFERIDTLKREPIDINYPFILTVGRLVEQKNHRLLIEAYASLFSSSKKAIPNLLILGEGTLYHELKNYIKSLGMENHIFLLGNVDNPYKYMHKCSLFVLSSLYEGFPNVLIEAMACEALCISTDCPTGPNEIIQHGVNGFLVNNKSAQAIAKAISYILFDNGGYDISKNKIRESVLFFNLYNISSQYIKLADSYSFFNRD